jgi:environmental stress-induced protein Ves
MPYGEEELLSQSVNGVSASAFKVTLIPENDYITMTWKNGAGTADEILIEPYGVDFKTQPFFWRFSRSEVCENVTFSIFPGYEISVIPLPTTNSEKYFKLRHNDQVSPQSVKVLIPYTYDGSLLTKCEVGGPRSYLMLLTNYKKIRDDISVENIDTDNGFRKLILAPSTIIYLVDGHITISMDSFPETDVIPGQTIHIECGESASPKYLQVNVQSKKNATFVLISLHDKSIPLWNELVSMPSSLSIDEEVVQRDRRGSVLVYDELPVFAVPDDRLPAFPLIIALSPKMHRVSKNQVYTPPSNSLNRSDIAPIPIPNACDKLNLDSFPVGKISTTWINMIKVLF